MQPESSDGLASVGTILPEEGAARISGGSFRFCECNLGRQTWAAGLRDPAVALRHDAVPVKSPLDRLDLADVAQLVEQLIRNQ